MTQASQALSEADRLDLINERASLALAMAASFMRRGDSLEDLEQEALLGLTKAAHDFRPDRNDNFCQHASVVISQHLCKYRAKHGDHPTSYRTNERLTKLGRARKALGSQGEAEPSVEQLAGAAGLTVGQAASALTARWHRLPAEPDSFATVDGSDQEMIADALEGLDRLSEKNQEVLIRRFGLDGGAPETCVTVGLALGIDERTVRRRISRALSQLRKIMVAT